MKLHCLGASQEVGRSGFMLDTGREKVLLDYGVKIVTEAEGAALEPELPLPVPMKIDGILISHGHLDHCGFVPALYHKGFHGSVWTTPTTLDLAKILLKDSLKLTKLRAHTAHFFEKDVLSMQREEQRVTYGQAFEIGNLIVSAYDAGHIPGSTQFHIDTGHGTFVYTGDLKVSDTELLRGMDPVKEKTDYLMIEATYADKDHPQREETEKIFIQKVLAVLENGGRVVLPSLAVGRAAELLLILHRYGVDKKFPVYMDGMARDATEIALKYPELLRQPKVLEKAWHNVKFARGKERKKVMDHPAIVITTSGMLNGGPVIEYIKRMHDDTKSAIFMTSFQVPGTAGNKLLETGRLVTEEFESQVKCHYERLDFSAHAGRTELIKYIKSLSPQKVVLVHGEKTVQFAQDLKEMGISAFAPKRGDIIDLA